MSASQYANGGTTGVQTPTQPSLPANQPQPGDNIVPGNFVPNNPYYVGMTIDPNSGKPRPINSGETPIVWYHSYADGTGNGQYEGNLSQWFRMGGGTLISGTGITDPNYGKTTTSAPAPTGNNWGGVNSQIATNTAASANAPIQNYNPPNNYLSPTQTNLALTAARDAYMRDATALQQAGQTSYAQILNAQGAWQNALLQQAAQGWQATPGWINYMYGSQNPYATHPSTGPGAGFYLQAPYSVSVNNAYDASADAPAPTPGLTGGVYGMPLFPQYNGGNYSTQVSGTLISPAGGQYGSVPIGLTSPTEVPPNQPYIPSPYYISTGAPNSLGLPTNPQLLTQGNISNLGWTPYQPGFYNPDPASGAVVNISP